MEINLTFVLIKYNLFFNQNMYKYFMKINVKFKLFLLKIRKEQKLYSACMQARQKYVFYVFCNVEAFSNFLGEFSNSLYKIRGRGLSLARGEISCPLASLSRFAMRRRGLILEAIRPSVSPLFGLLQPRLQII